MIKYPTPNNIIEVNKKVLSLNRAKKADKHDLLSYSKLTDIINKVKNKKGDLKRKASTLLKELTIGHVFASGNRRTAFLATVYFIRSNGKQIASVKETFDIFKRIRYGTATEEEIIKWLNIK